MRKYYHPTGVVTNGEVYCTYCGEKLDDKGMSGIPCSVQTANHYITDGYNFAVNVWNCSANLIVFKEIGNTREYYDIVADKKTLDEIDALVIKSVYESGGAINWSGMYPISDELAKYLEEKIGNGEIRFEKEK